MASKGAAAKSAPLVTYEERVKAQALENELFGGAEELVERLAGDAVERAGDVQNELFSVSAYMREVTADGQRGEEEVSTSKKRAAAAPQRGKRKPVWVDEEDVKTTVDIAASSRLRKLRTSPSEAALSGDRLEQRLRGQHRKLNPATSWAEPRKAAADPDEVAEGALESEAYLRRVGGVLEPAASRSTLPAGTLELTRVRDANMHDRSKAVVQSVEFHPNGQLLLAAGFDKHLRFFNADGLRNSVVQSLYLQDLPVATARFAAGGFVVVAAGHRKFFCILDLESQRVERVKGIQGCEERSLAQFAVPAAAAPADQRACIAFLGHEGRVPLVSLSSRQWVGELKMNGTARSAAFSADGHQLLTAGGDGLVYVWDVRMRRCVHRHRDEGCVSSTALALAPSGALFAAGSDAGIVNVYNHALSTGARAGAGDRGRLPVAPDAARPLRALDNLVTTVDTLAFSPDSQILCMASRMKKDALRLVHVPTLTVFSNWPTARSPLHFVHCAAFSPNGGFLAVGNAKGHVLMYRLHHYARA